MHESFPLTSFFIRLVYFISNIFLLLKTKRFKILLHHMIPINLGYKNVILINYCDIVPKYLSEKIIFFRRSTFNFSFADSDLSCQPHRENNFYFPINGSDFFLWSINIAVDNAGPIDANINVLWELFISCISFLRPMAFGLCIKLHYSRREG